MNSSILSHCLIVTCILALVSEAGAADVTGTLFDLTPAPITGEQLIVRAVDPATGRTIATTTTMGPGYTLSVPVTGPSIVNLTYDRKGETTQVLPGVLIGARPTAGAPPTVIVIDVTVPDPVGSITFCYYPTCQVPRNHCGLLSRWRARR
jgi:hypothetical protein